MSMFYLSNISITRCNFTHAPPNWLVRYPCYCCCLPSSGTRARSVYLKQRLQDVPLDSLHALSSSGSSLFRSPNTRIQHHLENRIIGQFYSTPGRFRGPIYRRRCATGTLSAQHSTTHFFLEAIVIRHGLREPHQQVRHDSCFVKEPRVIGFLEAAVADAAGQCPATKLRTRG